MSRCRDIAISRRADLSGTRSLAGGLSVLGYRASVPKLDPTARVRARVLEILSEGPVAFDDLLSRLIARGTVLGPRPGERLGRVLDATPLVDVRRPLRDDGPALCFNRVSLVDGVTWAIPLTELDICSDTLAVEAFGLLALPLVNGWCRLAGSGGDASRADAIGVTVQLDTQGRRAAAIGELGGDEGPAIALEPGWFASLGASAGDALLMRLDEELVTAEIRADMPDPSPEVVDALSRMFEDHAMDPGCVATGIALRDLLLDNPELHDAAFVPVDAMVDKAGLATRGGYIAPVGFDFDKEEVRRRLESVAVKYQFRDREVQTYAALLVTWHAWQHRRDELSPEMLQAAAIALGPITVATAFVDEERGSASPVEMIAFAEALLATVEGERRAGPAWLISQSHMIADDTEGFERWVDEALGFDPSHMLARHDKAWFHFDRGEAREARDLLVGLGADRGSHDVAILDAALAPHRSVVGRNDPCPCGSGRKYKQCHMGRDEVSLDIRLTWLYRKGVWWLERTAREQVEMAAWVRSRYSTMAPREMIGADPLIVDSVLVEGGHLKRWLSVRGSLLPEDEAALAAEWERVRRSVYEVLEVRLDEGVTVRDVRTGDVLDVVEHVGTHDLREGRYLLARPLPTGAGTRQFFGGLTIVPERMLGRFMDLLDSDPAPGRLMALVSEAEAPPTIANRDGQQTVFCEAMWKVDDVDEATSALGGAFESDSDSGMWLWMDRSQEPRDGERVGRTVLGRLALDGDRVVATTNSVERSVDLSTIVSRVLPGATLIEELRSEFGEIRDDLAYEREVFGEPDELTGSMVDPTEAPVEVQAALREQMDLYEQQWVDESIPALGGATPREALDDPTRREDLMRLLDRMAETEAAMPARQRRLGMRTDRLRELLGLPPGDKAVRGLRLPGA